MAKSLWEVFGDELNRAKCDWCNVSEDDLYVFEEEVVCRTCLEAEEYEEPERGLTLEERNR